MNIHQMLSLAHVVREGSVSAAARQMGVSQSAVSQHIAKLEAKVGAPLLIRGRDGVEMTPVGQELFELADAVTALDQQVEERLRGHVNLERGHLTIIANAPQPALSLIARYTEVYPLVSVDFSLLDWTSAMETVGAKHADIAVITEPSQSKELHVLPITKARFVSYMRQDHPLASHREIHLRDLESETLLLPERGSLTRRVATKAFAKAQLSPQRIVTMTTFPVMKEAILQGIGMGIFLEASTVADGQLVEVPIIELQRYFETAIVVPRYKMGLRITQSFLDLVVDNLP